MRARCAADDCVMAAPELDQMQGYWLHFALRRGKEDTVISEIFAGADSQADITVDVWGGVNCN